MNKIIYIVLIISVGIILPLLYLTGYRIILPIILMIFGLINLFWPDAITKYDNWEKKTIGFSTGFSLWDGARPAYLRIIGFIFVIVSLGMLYLSTY
jgi:hypothetical protein